MKKRRFASSGNALKPLLTATMQNFRLVQPEPDSWAKSSIILINGISKNWNRTSPINLGNQMPASIPRIVSSSS
jgi:hypothetical protein